MKFNLSQAAKVFLVLIVGLLVTVQVQARNTKLMVPIKDVTQGEFKGKLNSDIALYFGNQSHPAIERKHGEFPTNKKTNGVNKSDEVACNWAMLSAIIALQERAVREGGNAVVNIRSYYKKNVVSSKTEFECHAGSFMTGVALIGEVVTLK